MASGASTALPAYPLTSGGDWPRKFKSALATPATRWRVFIEDLEPVDHDVVLNTVLRIRQAGERDPTRISDLLQLPEDLIRYLLAVADQERLDAANSGRGIVALRSTVGWVYRDAATGELWPQPGEEIAPLEVRYTGSFRGRFDVSPGGNRTTIDMLLLDSHGSSDTAPTPVELARFSRSDDAQKRTSLIGSGEPCLVVSPVSRDKTGLAVLTTQDSPQLSLGRLLNTAAEKFDAVAKWAKGIPIATADLRKPALALVLDELTGIIDHLRADASRTVSQARFLSLIELSIGRWVDHYRFLTGIGSDVRRITEDETRAAAERFGLSTVAAKRWAVALQSDSRRKVLELLLAQLQAGDPQIRNISVVTARYDAVAVSGGSSQDLIALARAVVDAGQVLLSQEGRGHG